jgi:CMP-N-acetylneuraminic acid synthetase
VVQHAIRWLERCGDRFDAVCLLQPTNPLRRADDITRCIELFERSHADAVMTVLPVPAEYNPHWIYFEAGDGSLHLSTGEPAPIPRRQDLPPAFHREGSVYVTARDVVIEGNSMYGRRVLGCPMDPDRSVNINGQDDWDRSERMLQERTRLERSCR